MSLNISELKERLSIFINRPSKLGCGDPNLEELIEFVNSLTTLCSELVDPKFEYDGDNKCCICNEYYLEDEIVDQKRVKLQHCFHQAHKHCIVEKLRKNAISCEFAQCYNTNNWDKAWKETITNEIKQVEFNHQIMQSSPTRNQKKIQKKKK